MSSHAVLASSNFDQIRDMALNTPTGIDRSRPPTALADPSLIALVDAIVQAVDVNRCYELDRLRMSLEPFGGSTLFAAEIRINGVGSLCECCICGGEVF